MSTRHAHNTFVKSTILIDLWGRLIAIGGAKIEARRPQTCLYSLMAIGPKTPTPKLWLPHAFGPEARRILLLHYQNNTWKANCSVTIVSK